jgi:hypothetical protein
MEKSSKVYVTNKDGRATTGDLYRIEEGCVVLYKKVSRILAPKKQTFMQKLMGSKPEISDEERTLTEYVENHCQNCGSDNAWKKAKRKLSWMPYWMDPIYR